MYNIETLRECNQSYDLNHRIKQTDVDIANNHISVIESTRTEKSPQPGDLLRYTDEDGNYSHYGRIEKIDYDPEMLCGCADKTPWIYRNKADPQRYCVSVNGGSGFRVPRQGPRLIGKDMAGFKDWGHCGAGAGCAIVFMAKVNVWEYARPDAKFPPEYTTKFWCKQFMSFYPQNKLPNIASLTTE